MNPRVLIVDNTGLALAAARAALEPLDCILIPTTTLALGLFLAQKNFPDLIIADTVLPDGDGFQLLTELKRYDDLGALPIIFLSSKPSSDQDRQLAASLGAANFLNLPIDSDSLRKAVSPFLQERIDTREPQSPE